VAVLETEHGWDESELQSVLASGNVRLLYAMPTFHNPTGRTWSLETRLRFLAISGQHGVPILEDDFEQDLRFTGEAVPSLRNLCPDGRVLSAGTISKGLFPGARVGWVAGSREVIEHLAALKRYSDLSSGLVLQAALAEFLASGSYDDHLLRMRRELRRRHHSLQAALAANLDGVATWTTPEGGYVTWVTLPTNVDSRAFTTAARDQGVQVAAGHLFDPTGRPSSSVRLSVSCVDVEAIDAGIAILGRLARSMSEQQAGTATTPFL
jgi:2-aminoadipate transaminase